jgi:Family of unknown function (DUF5317)
MSLIVLILAVAVVAGFLAGGSLRPFEHLRVHWWAVAPIGLAIQGAPVPMFTGVPPDVLGAALLLGSYGMLLAFASVNRRLPGAVLVFAGLALNLAVIAPNGGMPVDPVAARLAGAGSLSIEGTAKHHLMSADDVVPFLGDVIGIPPPARLVLSFGDVVLYVGLVVFVVTTMCGLARENVRPPARWFQMYRGKHLPLELRGLPRRLLLPPPKPAAARWGIAP